MISSVQQPIYTVTDFVAICNQVLEVSFGPVRVSGELVNFKVSRNRWVYFDLKDADSSVRFFGTVYQLPGPLEDGMMLVVYGLPRLHPKFGFSITIQAISLVGEGTIKKAASLLESSLAKEGLFAADRKRLLPYAPTKIGLITSTESAAFADFTKIINQRWVGLEVEAYDVQVQGEQAAGQITEAINYFNTHSRDIEVIVIIRGGGSADDLQVFSAESVVRSVAASRIPTLVAIGHEVDLSLAEKAADVRASTPSNAAELLVPDKKYEISRLEAVASGLDQSVQATFRAASRHLNDMDSQIDQAVNRVYSAALQNIQHLKQQLSILSPDNVLKRGYAIVRQHNRVVSSLASFRPQDKTEIQFTDGRATIDIVMKEG